MRILIAAALLLLVGCSDEPGSTCGTDSEMGSRASAWDDPAVVLDRYDGPSFSELADIEVDGDRVWFCTGVLGVNVYDASDPADMSSLGRVSLAAGSQQYPRCQHLAVASDGRVYATNRGDALSPQSFISIIDGSDPGDPSELGSLLTDYGVEGVAVDDGLLVAAAHEVGLVVYERGSGAALLEVARLQVGLTNPWQVKLRDHLAYVADGTGGLAVVDLSTPAEPELVTVLDLPGVAKDLELDGDRAWVAVADAGLAVVSLDDARAPVLVEVENTPGSALGVAAGAGAIYVADWNDVRLFDATDRDDVRLVGREPVQIGSGADSRVLGVAARDDVFFAGNWTELVSHRFVPGVEAPDLTVSPRDLPLPDTRVGEEGVGLVRIANVGTRALSLVGVDADRSTLGLADPLPDGGLELAAAEEQTLVARWAPTSGGELDGWLAFKSDDPDQPRVCLPVRANGVDLSVGDSAPAGLAWVTLDGATIDLDDLLGAPVLLAYFATW